MAMSRMRAKPEEDPALALATIGGALGSGVKGARRSPLPWPPRRARSRTGAASAVGAPARAGGAKVRAALVCARGSMKPGAGGVGPDVGGKARLPPEDEDEDEDGAE